MTAKDRKNTYQKQYRQQKKHCLIIFGQEQYNLLKTEATKAGKPFGAFVRELALASASIEYILPYDQQTHDVKVLLVRYGTLLNQIALVVNSTKTVSPEIMERVRANFFEMQAEIKKIYNTPIEVKELVLHTLIKNPDYADDIQQVLTQLKHDNKKY